MSKKLTPVEFAAAVYAKEPCARTFKEDLELHLLNGYVISFPDVFVMARPVCSAAPYEQITDPAFSFDWDKQDAWWIYLAAGNLSLVTGYFPFKLNLIGWERGNRPRFYNFAGAVQMLRRCNGVAICCAKVAN